MSGRPVTLLPIGVLLLASAGCIPMAFVSPKWTSFPDIPSSSAEAQVHVFRSESTRDFKRGGFLCGWVEPGPARRRLTLVASPGGGQWTGERYFSLEYDLALWPLYTHSHTQGLSVKLYRPGYQTVDLADCPAPGHPVWSEAPDAASRMKALDSLWTSRAGDEDPEDPWIAWTADSAPALLFLAAEYEKLAMIPPQKDSDARSLLEQLRKRSDLLRSRAHSLQEPAPGRSKPSDGSGEQPSR